MALPEGFEPHIISRRRFLWLRERAARLEFSNAAAGALHSLRLQVPGTDLPSKLPGRATLLAAGILALEEIFGAGVEELALYRLSRAQAEDLITRLERGDYAMTIFQTGPRAGELYDQDAITILDSVTKTSSFVQEYEIGDRGTVRLDLNVSAISGSGALFHGQIETRRDSTDSWRVVDAFQPVSAVGSQRRSMSGLDRLIRLAGTIAGSSPTVTLSLSGHAV